MTFHRLPIIILFIIISACSPLKQIKTPDKPIERKSFSLLPPDGKGWRYVEQNEDDVYDLHFSRPGVSPTHTSSARYMEFKANTDFASPEHFLNYIRNMKESDVDQWEYKIIKSEWTLDNKFGEYSLHYFFILKYIDPGRMDPRDYSLVKRYGYVILHPYVDNIIIDIFYDEQGRPAEINPKFQENALKFIEGLHLKKEK